MPSHVKYNSPKMISFIFNLLTTLSSNIVVPSNSNPYELATTTEGGLHFILSDNSDNYDFDIKVKCCRFVGFVKDVIDFGFLRCVFYFRIKEKEKTHFILNFIQNYYYFYFSFLELNNYNKYVCNL